MDYDDVDDVVKYLSGLSAGLDTENVYWVHGDDEAECWCHACCRFKVRNLRRRNRKNRTEYCVDGGWLTEEDGPCFCAGCGKLLDCSLTRYGIEAELEHFLSYGFLSGASTIDPGTAYELCRVFEEGVTYEEFDGDLLRLANEIRKVKQEGLTDGERACTDLDI